jgi:hypothetical protein
MKYEQNSMPLMMEAPGMQWRVVKDFEGMAAAYGQLPAGADFTPMLKGLPDDLCQCPHWGYVIEGKLKVRYSDNSEEIISAGSIFYLPPGHTALADVDTKFIDFSPVKEFWEVVQHVTGKK